MKNTLELSDFQIISSLGQGSFSKVKLVKRLSDDRLLALKQISMEKLGHIQKNCALNQIRILASIKSPFIVSYEGSFYSHQTNSLCLLMEYAQNGDLQNIINNVASKTKRQKGLPEKFIWKVAIQILKGLKTLHQNKIAHRDIKSANIFIIQGVAKLGDFNVSSVSENSFYSTKTGTPYYTSPEIWNGQKYTTNCDIWSLGCIIYQMCALLPPFRGDSFPQLFASIQKGIYCPLSVEYSEDLRTLVRLCLTVKQHQRPSAIQLLNSLLMIQKINQFREETEQVQRVDLIRPIKCPKILRFINQLLPKPNSKLNSDNSANMNIKTQEGSELKQAQRDRQRICSIAKEKCSNIKSSIRIRSGKHINLGQPKETKSVHLIELKKEQKIQQINKKLKEKIDIKQDFGRLQKMVAVKQDIKGGKITKNARFRLRSCKRIQKQNYQDF